MIYSKARVFFIFSFIVFFSQHVRVGNKNKIYLVHFPIELNRRKHEIMFPSILIQLENGLNEFYFYLTIKMAISHQVLSLRVI